MMHQSEIAGAAERTPRPKSPPEYAGLYGKRRHLTTLTLLEKEINSLQEELKSLDIIQPSSRCCQEVNEFVVSRADPLLATGKSCFRPKGNSCGCCCCCCFSDDSSKSSGIRSKKPSSHRKSLSDSHQKCRGCCCKLDSFCCRNGNRECCSLPSVSCPQPSCCCTSSCCSFKLCSVGRSKCCRTCIQFTKCKCSCCC